MRGIADPFTLGIVIALIGTATVTATSENSKQDQVQTVESSQTMDASRLALREDEDE